MAWKHRSVPLESRVITLYSRMPPKEIAPIVGLNVTTIQQIRKKYHIPCQWGREHTAARRNRYDPKLWRQIFDRLYWVERRSMAEIGEIVHLGPKAVSKRMKEVGVPIRGRSGAAMNAKHKPYSVNFPKCPTPGCHRHIATEGQALCWHCQRRKPARIQSGSHALGSPSS